MIAAITMNVSVDRKYVVENSQVGAVNRVKECIATAGGKGLNVTRIIHAMGEKVIAGGIVGGNLGRYVCDQLEKQNIHHQFTHAQGETRCCINICDTLTGIQTEYLEPGMVVTETEMQDFLNDYRELCESCDVLTMSGSLPKGLATDTYAKLIALAKAYGRPVLLDTSGEALIQGIQAKPYFIKPNESEVNGLYPCNINVMDEVAQGAKKLVENGIDRVVVSMGKQGALLACKEGVFRGKPPAIKAVNTVGCGDSMTAAFAIAAEKNMTPVESMRYAIAVSAASALHPETGGVRLEDFKSIYPNVEAYPL